MYKLWKLAAFVLRASKRYEKKDQLNKLLWVCDDRYHLLKSIISIKKEFEGLEKRISDEFSAINEKLQDMLDGMGKGMIDVTCTVEKLSEGGARWVSGFKRWIRWLLSMEWGGEEEEESG